MSVFLYNVILAFLWSVLTGTINIYNLIIGFSIGYLILGSMHLQGAESTYFRKVGQVVGFLLFFLKELMVSSLRVAYDVITPTYHMRPGIIAIPLDAKTDLEITSLANIISLTPGTLSLDVSDDKKILYIHAMFIDDPDDLRREIKDGLEKKLLRMLR